MIIDNADGLSGDLEASSRLHASGSYSRPHNGRARMYPTF
jgi:hypothetical protein